MHFKKKKNFYQNSLLINRFLYILNSISIIYLCIYLFMYVSISMHIVWSSKIGIHLQKQTHMRKWCLKMPIDKLEITEVLVSIKRGFFFFRERERKQACMYTSLPKWPWWSELGCWKPEVWASSRSCPWVQGPEHFDRPRLRPQHVSRQLELGGTVGTWTSVHW